MGLPQRVIEQDHKLEKASGDAAEALCKLRWHWTLDDSNAERVTISEYARAIGRAQQWIHRDAHAYPIYTAGRVSINEARERAGMSAEKEAATEAVADAFGKSFKTVRVTKQETVRTVQEAARRRAEERGTLIADELPKQAKIAAKREEAEKRERQERKRFHTADFLAVYEALSQAYKFTLKAARRAENIEFDAEERKLLQDTIANFKQLLPILDRAVADAFDKSWQQEIRLIEGGKAS